MLYILAGPSTVGKSYCVEYLCTLNFNTLTPYTTRKARPSESEGLHYHFRTFEELKRITRDFTSGYWAHPLYDEHIYGYQSGVDGLSGDPGNWIIQAYSSIGFAIKTKVPDAVLIFLDFDDDETLRGRIQQRFGSEGLDVVKRRERHAAHERAVKARFDHRITSNSPQWIAAELLQLAASRSPGLSTIVLPLSGPHVDAVRCVSVETQGRILDLDEVTNEDEC
jgi:guanylate kinase